MMLVMSVLHIMPRVGIAMHNVAQALLERAMHERKKNEKDAVRERGWGRIFGP
jgi:hypothetical protein